LKRVGSPARRGAAVGCWVAAAALCVTVGVDSWLWQRWWVWPEGQVLLFNTVANQSSLWGTEPASWCAFACLALRPPPLTQQLSQASFSLLL
jgi:hypothetical protein